MPRRKQVLIARDDTVESDEEHRAPSPKRPLLNMAGIRTNETEEQKALRLEKKRTQQSTSRANETAEQRIARLERQKAARTNETAEHRAARLEQEKLVRENATKEQKALRLEQQRAARANETDEQKAVRLEQQRAARANETDEQKAERLEQQRAARANETDEQKAERLEKERIARRLAAERRLQKTAYRGLIDENFAESEFDLYRIGDFNVCCQFCDAIHFEKERPQDTFFNVCCNKGQVKLPTFETNEYIQKLMTGQAPDSQNFMDNIRSYNSSFAFASVGAQVRMPPGLGPYCFRIQGQLYHRAGTLHPVNEEQRKFAQIYILDPDEAISRRMNDTANQACKNHVMAKLFDIMQHNRFAQAYKMMYEVEKEENERAQREGRMQTEITMALLQNRTADPRRYNAQRCNEVAIVFSNKDGEPPLERDLLIHLRSSAENPSGFKRISILNKNLDALTYPLLYPNAEQGWGEDLSVIKNISATRKGRRTVADSLAEDLALVDLNIAEPTATPRKRISLKMYYSYLFSIRNRFSPILSAGKLTQQYFVDAYVKAEANDLNYVRYHQSELRAGSYSELVNHGGLNRVEGAPDGLPAGKKIILPSSFEGSPRNMNQKYQDAMAIVRKFGKPDLFVTMTCNPKWEEIVENLRPGERSENRPDLVARVFKLKLDELLDELTRKNVFGKAIAHVHVIEFQKRGLPHAHILIILKAEDKPTTAALIDRIVRAEIPTKATHPRLFDVVTKNMIHGPCDKPGSRSPCLVNGQCSKGFPKQFQSLTSANCNGYPLYRRRDHGTQLTEKNVEINNSWVVPYSPYLSLRYNCHINVEVCVSIKSVKYLFKYAYKGYDCANIQFNADEVQTHVDSRYVSAPEAAHRIYRFKMQKQSHTVARLAVHLEDEQSVTFESDKIEEAIQKAENRDSTLLAWFKLNQFHPEARQYKYFEIPEYYIWENARWKPRKKGGEKVIGRMHLASMRDQERYFLRLLLLHVPGATSFEQLKSYNGQTYPSYYDAATARGLSLSESVWDDTLDDAACSCMPRQFRELFAYICVFGNFVDARNIWNKHRENLIENYAFVHGHPSDAKCEDCDNYALRDIQDTLIVNGKKCSDFKLPDPPSNLPLNICDFADIESERELAEELNASLNEEQIAAFEKILDAMGSDIQNSKCFFLDGPGGSGKTYLYRTLLSYVRGQGEKALPVASTGIAANLLKGGRTYHSQYKVPLKLNDTSVSGIRPTSKDAHEIRTAKLLIWDESTMAPANALNCVDRLLRDIMQNDIPFGGKVLLLGGDFRQTLPIIPHGDAVAVVQASIKFSHLWDEFKVLKLKNNVRSVDIDYSNWLIKLGNGELTNEDGLPENLIVIPESMLASDNIIKDIFGDKLTPENVEAFSKMAILCPTNQEVDKINEKVLNILEGETKTYLSSDSLITDEDGDRDDYPLEFLNSLNPSGSAPHILNLKKGALIMLLRNLNTKRGLCNGTRLIVVDLKPNLIIAKVLTGSAEGNVVFIPRIDLITDSDLPFQLKRRQFPVKLAFAMTINKSQGQTLDKVGIYLATPVFSHGQLYVAFSRVRRSCDVKVHVTETAEQGKLSPSSEKVYTRNVVFKDILAR